MGKVKKLRIKAAAKLSSAEHPTVSKNLLKETINNEGKIKLNTNIANKVHKKKSEKLKQRKADFIKKINLIKEQKTKLQKKERAKRSLVKNKQASFAGDLKSLKDALPSLDELVKLKRDEIKVGYSGTQSDDYAELSKKGRINKRKQILLTRYNCFETLLKDPEYKRNPRDAIAFHIRYTNGLETKEN